MRYAEGKHAFGFCDRCSQRYPLKKLKYEIYNKRRNGLRVCPSCLDEDHPQLRLNEVSGIEYISLRDPRPEKNLAESRKLFSFDPVMSPKNKIHLGSVKVTTE